MEEGIDPVDGMLSGPVKRPLSPDDEFFDAGNIQRAVLCKMSVFSLESGCNYHAMSDGEDDSYLGTRSYQCRFNGCTSTFSSLAKVSSSCPTSRGLTRACSIC